MYRKAREKSPYFLVAMDFGYTMLAAVGIFGYIGWWADRKYGTNPWFLLLGIGLGMATAFNGLFKRLNALESREKARKKGQRPDEPKS